MQKDNLNPTWNESLILSELFPPLCQRIKILLKQVDTFSNITSAVHHINLRSISNPGEHGFLPTFGPTFVYFYAQNAYVGKVLISITTEVLDATMCMSKSVAIQPAAPAKEVRKYLITMNTYDFLKLVERSFTIRKHTAVCISLRGYGNKQEIQ